MDIEKTNGSGRIEAPEFLVVGTWYWLDEVELVCLTRIGSNYALVTGIGGRGQRIHFDHVLPRLMPAPEWKDVVKERTVAAHMELREAMDKIKEITHEIGMQSGPKALDHGIDTAMVMHGSEDGNTYIQRLEKIKDKILPDLFNEVKELNTRIADLMGAELLPLNTQVHSIHSYQNHIRDRIFNVSLYAGLEEQIITIREGDCAPQGTKVDVMQRLLYMDEEALLRWDDGGLEFKDLAEFDTWLAKDDNFSRILPFERCVVAFRVRRHERDRSSLLTGIKNVGDYYVTLKLIDELRQKDRHTFMYIRNGDNLYRLIIPIEFRERLFPDPQDSKFGQPLMVRKGGCSLRDCITLNEYEHKIEKYKVDRETWKYRTPFWDQDPEKEYVPLDDSYLYLDDVEESIIEDMNKNNRVALVLQGLFDRSHVFHPHDPVQLWKAESFSRHIRLRFDSDRTLYPFEEAPDIKEYIDRINSKIQVGSVCVGQFAYWYEKQQDNWKRRTWNNDGPHTVSKVVDVKSNKAKFVWYRKILSGKNEGRLKEHSVWVPFEHLFNISGYRRGDFKRFFLDPRSRQAYLEWAPLMFMAEDYYAGKVQPDPERSLYF